MPNPGAPNALLVIPVYNHGATLPSVVKSALATGLPVLVVDDGSTDGGPDGIAGLPCRLLRLAKNDGKGAAILAGAREARRLGYRVIITLDADGQHDPQDAHALLQAAADALGSTFVIGARRMVQETVPAASRFGRAFSNFWVRLECGLALDDTQSGFRLYPVDELLRLPLTRTRYDFEIEALVTAAWAGIAVRSVPIAVHYPPAAERISHFCKLKDNLRLSALHAALVTRRLLRLPLPPTERNPESSGATGLTRRLEALGHAIFYLVLRLFGQTGAYALLLPVVFTYVLCSRKIHRLTASYLERCFPDHTRGQRWLATFRIVLSFGRVLVDRAWLGCVRHALLTHEVIGQERLDAIIASGKGAVLLTAHVGNWQTAIANLHFLQVPVHVMMQYDPQAAARHFFDLGAKRRAFTIINTDGPFGGMIEAASALQRGELVTIMGDRLLKGPASTVDFLGRKMRFPHAAYVLAAHVGVPVVVLLAAKTGKTHFHLQVADVLEPRFPSHAMREEILRDCSRKFAEALEKYLKIFPYQWYNFFDFWAQ